MGKVFLVDTNKRPLDPVHPGWARKLLNTGQAAVLRRYPFTLILKKQVAEEVVRPLRLKLDPGSKTTGFVHAKVGQVTRPWRCSNFRK